MLVLVAAVGAVAATSTSGTAIANAPALHVRKDVKDLTPQEKADFVAAVLELKQTPSPYNSKLSWYDQFVQWQLVFGDGTETSGNGREPRSREDYSA